MGLYFHSLFEHESTTILILISALAMCVRMFVFRSIYKPSSSVAFVPSVGRELPSHYCGSTTSRRLCVSVSPNLPLFSLLSLVIFLFHSLRQPPPLPFRLSVHPNLFLLCTLSPLLSCQSLFFPHCHSLSFLLLLNSPLFFLFYALITRSLNLYLYFVCCFFSVKDLDTEKYVHLVSFFSLL